jgi:4-oxalocrotonate tautomerase
MPLVTVKGIEGVCTPEQKRQLIRRLTDVMVEFGGEELRPATSVVIEDAKPEDVQPDHWCITGNALRVEDARTMQLGAAAITEAIGATWCA